jgi:hypothetical protein
MSQDIHKLAHTSFVATEIQLKDHNQLIKSTFFAAAKFMKFTMGLLK